MENSGTARTKEPSEDSEGAQDIIRSAREEYGRYFGVCGSYHHLKACLCRYCSAFPEGRGMFCARGGVIIENDKKEDCLCETCELFKTFRFEGSHFCQLKEKLEAFERKKIPPNICTRFRADTGTPRVCVLNEQKFTSR
ncbi:MAG TPA: DUF2769 domain-containing protein [Methanosarcina sp.]|nr:DUF2769 domain-containing protein [Methanosarcina sp.]